MKTIRDGEQLVGKTIAFVHIAQFADQITLVTRDGEILMVSWDIDESGESVETRTLNKGSVLMAIQRSSYLQDKLNELGVFNLVEYKKKREEETKRALERYKQEQSERELKLLAELKEKYENTN